MTTEATLPSTATSPTARQVWTRTRGIVIALVLLLVAAAARASLRVVTTRVSTPRSARRSATARLP